MTFLLTLNASTIRPTPLVEKLHIASRAGYSGIELWHNEIEDYLQQGGRLADLRACLNDLGLIVPSTINLKGWFEAQSPHDAAWETIRFRMSHAAEIGSPFIVAGPPQHAVDWQRGAENFRRLVELGTRYGVSPSMEFLGFVDQVNSIESALRVLRESQVANPTIVLDPFHIARGGGSFDSVSLLSPEKISICHFNDARPIPPPTEQTDADRVLPGMGCLPLVSMLRTLLRIGYHGPLSLELFSEELWSHDPLEVARRGIELMRQLIDEAQSRSI